MTNINTILQHGDLLSMFNPSPFGMIKKVITRKGFIQTGIFLDFRGRGMVATNYKGRIFLITLAEFNKLHKHFAVTHLPFPCGAMKEIFNTYGQKKDTAVLFAELHNLDAAERFDSDSLYREFNNV